MPKRVCGGASVLGLGRRFHRASEARRHEVEQYDGLLGQAERLGVNDVVIVSALNLGQALIFCAGLGTTLAMCARGASSGVLTIGDVAAVHGLLLQLHAPLCALGFTYQEIRQSLTDLRQLLQLLRRMPQVVSPPGAPPLRLTDGGTLRFDSFVHVEVTHEMYVEAVTVCNRGRHRM